MPVESLMQFSMTLNKFDEIDRGVRMQDEPERRISKTHEELGEAVQGMPRSSHLVNPLEIYKRQRRAFRSSRLTPAGRCTGLLMGQA
jgi:hypothetical protein